MTARLMTLGLLALLLAGCGSGIGDGCSKDQDCGGRTCDLSPSFPGGYCTQRCTVGDDSSCPTGAKCVNHHAVLECLRGCAQDLDCRGGYSCHAFKDQGSFCLAPDDR